MRRNSLKQFILALAWGFAFSLPTLAAIEPSVPNGECKKTWAKRGFTGKKTLFQIGGRETYQQFYERLDRDNCFKEWTIAIYMAANNDLSPYSFRDLWEMESVGSSLSVDVVVFHDSAINDGNRYYPIAQAPKSIDYTSELRKYIEKNQLENLSKEKQEETFLKEFGPSLVASPAIEKFEGDSGDINTSGKFLHWVLSKYPSRRLMLIGWGHGEGFDSAPMDTKVGKLGGFAFNQATGSHMNVVEMAQGMRELNKQYRRGIPADIVGSDACLNQQVEFGFEWLGVADYVFGSSTIIQKKGFNYRTLLGYFRTHPLKSTAHLAAQIPALYGTSVSTGAGREYSSYYDPKATMATWNSEELVLVARALDELGTNLAEWLEEPTRPLEKIKRQTELQEVLGKSLRLGGVSNDLQFFLLFLNNWAKDRTLKPIVDSIRQVMDTLQRAVLAKHIGLGYIEGLVLTSKGVGIWLPNSENDFNERLPLFKNSAFYRAAPGWANFIEKIY